MRKGGCVFAASDFLGFRMRTRVPGWAFVIFPLISEGIKGTRDGTKYIPIQSKGFAINITNFANHLLALEELHNCDLGLISGGQHKLFDTSEIVADMERLDEKSLWFSNCTASPIKLGLCLRRALGRMEISSCLSTANGAWLILCASATTSWRQITFDPPGCTANMIGTIPTSSLLPSGI